MCRAHCTAKQLHMNSAGNSYRPDIDGLRAFSIIAVVIYHAFPTVLPGGFVGVDVFFVISGYLISTILLQGLEAGDFSIAGFYRRRIQRIIPALLLVLAFSLIAGWLVLLPYEYATLGKHTTAASVFVPNLLFWTEAGYFDTDSKLKPLLHLWSLGVEEQFYLLWPLLLLLASRLGIKKRYLIATALLTSFSLGILYTGDRAGSFFLPHFRVWELLLGATLAWAQLRANRRTTPSAFVQNVTGLLGLTLMCLATIIINRQSQFPGWWALLPTLGAALVIFAGPRASTNRLLLSNPVLVLIGKISFPLYLWHWPLLSFARIMESGEPTLSIRWTAVALSVVLAWLSYRLVEAPLRYHPSRVVPVTLMALLFSLGAAGYFIHRLDGIPARTASVNPAAEAFLWNELQLHERDDCSEQLAVPGRCLSDGKPAQIAVLGDSHSTNVFFALAHHFKDSDTGVTRLGKGGCPPLYNVTNEDSGNRDTCLHSSNGNLDWVLENPAINTVYLSSLGPMYLNPKQRRYRMSFVENPGLGGNQAVFSAALEATVARLLAADKHVVLVIDWPGLGFNPKLCVNTRPLRLTELQPADCRIPRKRYDRRSADYRTMLMTVLKKYPSLQYWDTAEVFCDQRYCHGEIDGTMLYRDPAHLSLPGSRYLGDRLQLENAAQL